LPVVDIGDVIFVEVSVEHHIFEEGGTLADGNHNLAGEGLGNVRGVKVCELAGHIHQAVSIAEPIISVTLIIRD
jgi:hypothetical protein